LPGEMKPAKSGRSCQFVDGQGLREPPPHQVHGPQDRRRRGGVRGPDLGNRGELAQQMGCGPARISEIVRGKRTITAETSILLGRALGVSPGFFLGLQFDYDLACAALRLRHRVPSPVTRVAAV
jgi:addiction module HigA family antidote